MRSQLSANVFVRYNNGHSYQEGMFASSVLIVSVQSIGRIAPLIQNAQEAYDGSYSSAEPSFSKIFTK